MHFLFPVVDDIRNFEMWTSHSYLRQLEMLVMTIENGLKWDGQILSR